MKLMRIGPKGHERPAILDSEGRVRLFVRHDQTVDDLVHDLRLLLGG